MDDVESILPNLYKLAIEKVVRTEPLLPVAEGVFSFKEDAELHSEIVQLDGKYRLPFILTTFHSLDAEQISLILGKSTTEIETDNQTAIKLLGEEHLGKRLKLLGKSYERIPVQFKSKQIMVGAVQREVS